MVAESSKYTKNVKANIDDLETLLTKKKKSLSRAEEMYGNQVLSNSSKKFTDAVKAVMAAQSDFDKATKKKHGAKLKEMYPEKSQTEVDAMLDDPKKLQAVGEGWRGFGRFGRIEARWLYGRTLGGNIPQRFACDGFYPLNLKSYPHFQNIVCDREARIIRGAKGYAVLT